MQPAAANDAGQEQQAVPALQQQAIDAAVRENPEPAEPPTLIDQAPQPDSWASTRHAADTEETREELYPDGMIQQIIVK